MDLSRPLNSGMVVEDHESTEGVILEILETYNDGTTTILCYLNKRYGLPDKPTSNRRLQFVSRKSERPLEFKLTTNTTHYPEKNGISERTNSETWKSFFPILEYNKKPRMTHKLIQQKSNKQIPKQERLFEESKKSSIFRNYHPELSNHWKSYLTLHASILSTSKKNNALNKSLLMEDDIDDSQKNLSQ